jgi:hypothetical protein
MGLIILWGQRKPKRRRETRRPCHHEQSEVVSLQVGGWLRSAPKKLEQQSVPGDNQTWLLDGIDCVKHELLRNWNSSLFQAITKLGCLTG